MQKIKCDGMESCYMEKYCNRSENIQGCTPPSTLTPQPHNQKKIGYKFRKWMDGRMDRLGSNPSYFSAVFSIIFSKIPKHFCQIDHFRCTLLLNFFLSPQRPHYAHYMSVAAKLADTHWLEYTTIVLQRTLWSW